MDRLALIFFIFALSSPFTNGETYDFIKSSCNATLYPNLCFRILSPYAQSARRNTKSLAQIALNVSLKRARSARSFVSTIAKAKGLKRLEYHAVKDCIETFGDGVDRLRQSIGELARAGPAVGNDFSFHLSNVQTWVSSALTDADTCLDGFDRADGRVKAAIRRRVEGVARVTSVGLALVNRFAARRH